MTFVAFLAPTVLRAAPSWVPRAGLTQPRSPVRIYATAEQIPKPIASPPASTPHTAPHTTPHTTHRPTSATPPLSVPSATPLKPMPVEKRPELVGGLPLWLAIGAVSQLARFARSLLSLSPSSDSTNILTGTLSPPRQPEPATEQLRDLAARLEHETFHLQTQLRSARASAETWRVVAADAQRATQLRQDGGNDAAGKAASRLLATLMTAQTREACANRENAVLRARLAVAQAALDKRDRDVVQAALLVSLAAVALGAAVVRATGTDAVISAIRHAVGTS